jgi:hypothetical protein
MDIRITLAIMTNPVVQSEVWAKDVGITACVEDIKKLSSLFVDLAAKAHKAHAEIMLKTLAEQGDAPEPSRILRPKFKN